MLVSEGDQLRHGIVHDLGVWVQQQDVATCCDGDALVIGSGEATIVLVGDEADVGEILAHHIHTAVLGAVVHDDDLKSEVSSPRCNILTCDWLAREPCLRTGDGLQAALQEAPDIPADDDNGEVNHR
jgi:hypothetical protein